MAFNANTNWEVRTTGNDANGGGFNVSATGTDFSQQDSPQFAYTDLVIGATNTQITSIARPFSSVDVGNIINITAGTGFTVQRVQITSVSAGVATCDKAVGTAASTGGTGNLGGGLATLNVACPLCVGANIVWVQTGTYTITTAPSIPVSQAIFGYGTTHGDNAGSATLAANLGTTGGTVQISANSPGVIFRNLNFTKVGGASSFGIYATAASAGLTIENCSFTGLTYGINLSYYYINIHNCSFVGCTGAAISGGTPLATYGQVTITDSYFSVPASSYAYSGVNIVFMTVKNCLFVGASGAYYAITNTNRTVLVCENNTFTGFTGIAAIGLPSMNASTTPDNFVVIRNNIFYGNRTAVTASAAFPGTVNPYAVVSNNALGSNTTNYSNMPAGTNDVALTANPFMSGSDYSLNSTAGGGAACKGVGWPGTSFPGGNGESYPDIGAFQSTGGAGPSVPSNYAYSG